MLHPFGTVGAFMTEQNRLALLGAVVLGVGALLGAVAAPKVLFVVFGGVLLAVFLEGLASSLAAHSPLRFAWSLALVTTAVLALSIVGLWLFLPRMAAQADQLLQRLPELLGPLQRFLSQYAWGRALLGATQPESEALINRLTGVLSTSMNTGSYLALMAVMGVYLAADPALYSRGLVLLLPPSRRDSAYDVLQHMAHTLRWFLLGRAISMILVAVLTVLALYLLGIPMAVLLGVTAGLLTFVPYIGPLLGGIPIGLVALMSGTTTMVLTIVIYTAIQWLEGFVVTPIVQQRAVSLPPALTLAAQLLLGVLFGPWGVALAVPIAAVLLVFTRKVYLEGVLGDAPSAR